METSSYLKTHIKEIMIDELMLQDEVSEISDETPVFSPEGLGLDSVDALQLVVALEKHFGLKLDNADAARTILGSVNSMAQAIEEHQAKA